MSGSGNGAIAGPLRMLFESGTAAGASDAELLDRFVQRGPGAEGAFSALLDRHGSMVLAVCRRFSGDSSSADDAFQATWLELVRRSGSIRLRGSLAPWLFAVSRRIALRARCRADRLRLAGVPAPEPVALASPDDLAERADLIRTLLDEIARLPECYRAPLVLCHLESRTHDQAAGDLGWPVGTVRTRLSRGRRLLRDRLERRGVGLSIAAALDGLRREAMAAVPHALEATTSRLASLATAGAIAAGAIPPTVLSLQHGVSLMLPLSIGMTAIAGTLVLGIAWGIPGESEVDPRVEARIATTPLTQQSTADRPDEPLEYPNLELSPLDDPETKRLTLLHANQEDQLEQLRQQVSQLTEQISALREQLTGNPMGLPKPVASAGSTAPLTEVLGATAQDLPQESAGVEKPVATDIEKPAVQGEDALAENAVEPTRADIAGLLEPTIEEVERLFVEKASEAVEIESTIDAWERLKGVDSGEGTPTEIGRLLNQTRKKLEARLAEFAGDPDKAASELERLRSELKDLLALDVALVGPEGESAQMLATQCVAQFSAQFPDDPVIQMGMLVNRPGQQRVYPFALRIQSLFARLGVEVGPPINYGAGGLRFGMGGGMSGGMGGMGGGFQ
ncbi:RNA polymerase sigma factor [Tautonia plasticadhaerens]|uniref:ECF RNA polymerase sigma factor SigE n=1 Tax=Tautonia plasticadhaerens TaxID=2527974 RepID=A0A518GVQ2_9BACT|nr:RNA polymerase sigma factor [Tautonia plasticadhaerens]QDV32673.1 ECF RNA polymerase sigma factor SigE [Tautonia plasticadhaerens]